MSTAPERSGPDDRVILLTFASYAAWLVLLRGFVMLAAVVGAMVLLLAVTSPAPGLVFRRWARMSPAALVVAVLTWVFAPGGQAPWFTLLGKPFGPEGLVDGLFFAVRFLGFLLGGLYLYETSSPESTARAVIWFSRPLRALRVPVHLLHYIIWFALRTIPVLTTEAQITGLAQRARGAKLSGFSRQRLAASLSLVVPVFAAGARRADRFALALQARGFDPAVHYRSCRQRRLRASDWLWLGGLALLWVCLIAWRQG